MEGHSEGFFEGWGLVFEKTNYKDKIQHYFQVALTTVTKSVNYSLIV